MAVNTLDYMVQKFNIDLNQPSPIALPIGRFKDLPKLFAELNFTEGAEVGVYRGSYARSLLKYNPKLHLIGVDLWQSYPGFKDYEAHDLIDAEAAALKNVEGFNCDMRKGWAHDIAQTIPDGSLDFVFLDGNHAYEYVVQDLADWAKKVKPGGIVYGHDYDDYSCSKRWAEMNVIAAVNGWVKAYQIKPLFYTTNNSNKCWLYVKN